MSEVGARHQKISLQSSASESWYILMFHHSSGTGLYQNVNTAAFLKGS
jgi:hypothetical protein